MASLSDSEETPQSRNDVSAAASTSVVTIPDFRSKDVIVSEQSCEAVTRQTCGNLPGAGDEELEDPKEIVESSLPTALAPQFQLDEAHVHIASQTDCHNSIAQNIQNDLQFNVNTVNVQHKKESIVYQHQPSITYNNNVIVHNYVDASRNYGGASRNFLCDVWDATERKKLIEGASEIGERQGKIEGNTGARKVSIQSVNDKHANQEAFQKDVDDDRVEDEEELWMRKEVPLEARNLQKEVPHNNGQSAAETESEGYPYDVTSSEFKKAIRILTRRNHSLLISAYPGPRRDAFVSTLKKVYRQNSYTVYTLSSVTEWDRMGPIENGSLVLFDSAFGVARLETKQYNRFYRHGMYRMSDYGRRIKLVFLVFPHVLKELCIHDRVSISPLLSTVGILELAGQPSSVQHHADLFLRMLCDSEHGQIVAALMALIMMGEGYLGYPDRTAEALKRLGFKHFYNTELHLYSSVYKGSLLDEYGMEFIDRAVYEAAGIALSCHYRAVLIQVCDAQFLVQRLGSLALPSPAPPRFASRQQNLSGVDSIRLMQRLYDSIMRGQLQETCQHPCLHSPSFLQQFKYFCKEQASKKRGKKKENDRLQQLLVKTEKEHGVSLLYYAVWMSAVLTDWCLDAMLEQHLDNGFLSYQILHAAFAAAILRMYRDDEVTKLLCHTNGNITKLVHRLRDVLARDSLSSASEMLSMPLPSSEHRYSPQLDTFCSGILQRLIRDRFYYLGVSSREIPRNLFTLRLSGDVINVFMPAKQPYVTFRMLADSDVNEQDVQGNTLLHLAAENGLEEVVQMAVISGASLTIKNQMGLTPPELAARAALPQKDLMLNEGNADPAIHKAVYERDINAVKCLLCQNSTTEDVDSFGRTPLHIACALGETGIAALLISLNADINGKDRSNYTPLHFAVSHEKSASVELLLSKGADLHARNVQGLTPLHTLCIETDNIHIAELLLSKGARVNARSATCCVPLLHALGKGHFAVAEILCKHNANVNISGLKPAFYKKILEAQTIDSDVIGEIIRKMAAEVNFSTLDDEENDDETASLTMLFAMSSRGCTEGVRLLLAHGAKVDMQGVGKSQELHFACQGGHLEVARLLLDHGANINSQNSNGCTPLYLAVKHGHREVVRFLVSKGADVNRGSEQDCSPLFPASFHGNDEILKILIDHGADVNTLSQSTKMTPLVFAIVKSNRSSVELLLRHGANPNYQAQFQYSCFFLAYEFDLKDMLGLFLQFKADPNVTDEKGITVLHKACVNGEIDIVHKILEYTSDLNVEVIALCGEKGMTPLGAACVGNNAEIAELLIASGADVNTSDESGCTALHWTCSGQYPETLGVLLKHGANVNKQLASGETPVLLALQHGEDLADCVHQLLQHGADVNLVTENGVSPLHRACLAGCGSAVQLLLDRHADVNAVDRQGVSALLLASNEGHAGLVQTLLQHNADPNLLTKEGCGALWAACSMGHLDIVRTLLEHGAKVEAGENQAYFPLHKACVENNAEMVKLFLDHGAAADKRAGAGITTLQSAAFSGCSDVISLLLNQQGVDVNARDEKGHTALQLAVVGDHTDSVRLLVQQPELNVNAASLKDLTALSWAVVKQNSTMVSILLEHPDIDVEKTYVSGFTPLFIACYLGKSTEIAQLLVQKGANAKATCPYGESILDLLIKNRKVEMEKVLRQSTQALEG